MSEDINHHRRQFLGAAAMTIAATRLGALGSASAQAVPAIPTGPFGPVKQIGRYSRD
jgi:nitrous oxide reductase